MKREMRKNYEYMNTSLTETAIFLVRNRRMRTTNWRPRKKFNVHTVRTYTVSIAASSDFLPRPRCQRDWRHWPPILGSRHISSRRTSTIRRLRDPNRTICVSLIRLRTADGRVVDLAKGTSKVQLASRVVAVSFFPPSRNSLVYLSSVFRRRHRFPIRDTSISGIPARVFSPRTSSAITRFARARSIHGCVRVCSVCSVCARAHTCVCVCVCVCVCE